VHARSIADDPACCVRRLSPLGRVVGECA
jgi:hypothetical protein